jgi:hypothetical protein
MDLEPARTAQEPVWTTKWVFQPFPSSYSQQPLRPSAKTTRTLQASAPTLSRDAYAAQLEGWRGRQLIDAVK